MQRPHLSVVIPSYNEMVNLQKGVLDKVEHFLTRGKYNFEVIVVDDGSTDGSAEFVEAFSKENPSFHLLRNNHTGKAGAVTAGMLAAKGEHILFTDMDQATPIEEVAKLLPYFEEDYDIVIGSRVNDRKGSPLMRQIMSRGMMFLRNVIVGFSNIRDTQCGFKMFRHDVAKELFQQMHDLHHGYQVVKGSSVTAGFDVELLFLAQKKGFKIKEAPVHWLYVETRRVSPIKDSLDGLRDLIRIRIKDMQHTYD